MGLQALSRYFLGINLNKDPQLQRSNWQCRNLSLEQVESFLELASETITTFIPFFPLDNLRGDGC